MSTVNRAIVVGHVGKDPEIKTIDGDRKIAVFSVATAERWRNNAGDKEERTDWHAIVVMNEKLVSVVEQYVHKGSKVYIEGQMQTREWKDKDGIKRYRTEVVMNPFKSTLVLLDKAEGSYSPSSEKNYGGKREDLDDEIPF